LIQFNPFFDENDFPKEKSILKRQLKRSIIMLPFLLFAVLLAEANAQKENSGSIKAFWVIRDRLVSKESVTDIVQTARRFGFNHIFAQVRGRGDAYYNSNIVVKAPEVRGRIFDPLKELITQAHRNNIKVHAWTNVYLLWSSDKKPKSEKHFNYISIRNESQHVPSRCECSFLAEGDEALGEPSRFFCLRMGCLYLLMQE